MNIEMVFPQVSKIIAKVLGVEESEITLKKRLIDDLGAESIDFLDLVFRLEREFKIKLPRSQFDFQNITQNESKGPSKTNDLSQLLTVEAFCDVVVKAFAKK